MSATPISKSEVIARSSELPTFPRIVAEILATLEDPESNIHELSEHIVHDPVIAARVLSQANRASYRSRTTIRDIYTAASMIGLAQIREIALLGSVGRFIELASEECLPDSYWKHSVAVGICSQELAIHIPAPIFSESALIAGVMHDIGQLWLYRFHQEAFAKTVERAFAGGVGIDVVERDQFGVDHAQIGAWLAEGWQLPSAIVASIRHHHRPDLALTERLVPVVSVAEVLTNALDIGAPFESRVTTLSSGACSVLGLRFDESIQPLFGRIEARSAHANKIFSRCDA